MATPLRRVMARCFVGAFLLLIGGGAAVDLLWPLPMPPVIGRELARSERERSAASFARGSLARLFEKDLRITSTVRDFFLPWYAGMLYFHFAEVDPQLLTVGRDGWVFQKQRLTAKPDPAAKLINRPSSLINALSRRLDANGTKLVVCMVPRKEELYYEYLREQLFPVRPELYPLLIQELRARGVLAADIAAALRQSAEQPTFFKTDTHWNSVGVLCAAEACAEAAGVRVPPEQRLTAIHRAGTYMHSGDLLRIAGVFRPDGTGYLPAREECPHVGLVLRKNNAPFRDTLAKSIGECMVTGTSYTWNGRLFPTMLSHVTNQQWAFAAWPALGPVEPMHRCVRMMVESRFPKVLLWEIPDYEVFCTPTEWDGMGRVFTALPATGLRPLITDSSGASAIITPPSKLVVGNSYNLTREPTAGWMIENRLIHPGSGCVTLKLSGTVTGGPVRVALSCDAGRMSADWAPGRHEILLPLVAPTNCGKLHVVVSAPVGAATLALDSVALLTDLSAEIEPTAGPTAQEGALNTWCHRVVFAPEARITRSSVALVEIGRLKPAAYPLVVVAERSDGAELNITITKGLSEHTVLLNLAAWAGHTVKAIRVQGAGADPGIRNADKPGAKLPIQGTAILRAVIATIGG